MPSKASHLNSNCKDSKLPVTNMWWKITQDCKGKTFSSSSSKCRIEPWTLYSHKDSSLKHWHVKDLDLSAKRHTHNKYHSRFLNPLSVIKHLPRDLSMKLINNLTPTPPAIFQSGNKMSQCRSPTSPAVTLTVSQRRAIEFQLVFIRHTMNL